VSLFVHVWLVSQFSHLVQVEPMASVLPVSVPL